jgi:hypothetical protein
VSVAPFELSLPESKLSFIRRLPFAMRLGLNLISVLAKLLFRSTTVFPTSVAVECIWTACFVILNMSRSSIPGLRSVPWP